MEAGYEMLPSDVQTILNISHVDFAILALRCTKFDRRVGWLA